MTDTPDYKLLSIYIVFGFFILVGYAFMIKKYNKNSSDIWSNKNKNIISKKPMLKYIYIFMILLSFIATPYLIYYLVSIEKSETDEILIYIGSVFFIICSTVWAFLPFTYSGIILAGVAIGAILILAGVANNQPNQPNQPNKDLKNLALASSSILVIQTFLFDFLIWNGFLKF